MVRFWLVILAAAAACQFDEAGVSRDAAGDPEDAGPGDGAFADAFLRCTWSFGPAHFDPCDLPEPAGSITITADDRAWTYDTVSASLTAPSGTTVAAVSTVIDGVRVISVEDLVVESGARLQVGGSLPLLIVAWGEMTVEGEIDASSRGVDPARDFRGSQGPGADPASCGGAGEGASGTEDNDGGGGGGGGGFAGAGGKGGDGGLNKGDGVPGPGGDGGTTLAEAPSTLRGGCPGGAGAEGDGATPGQGGSGGGAVQLSARLGLALTSSGTIHAGGAGGGHADNGRSGGGGGGSGGLVALESPFIEVAGGARLAANGGGGGGGANGNTAQPGENGGFGDQRAAGGAPDNDGGQGGPGGALGAVGGGPGNGADRGGGGGGGGVGFVILSAGDLTIDEEASISPAQVERPLGP